MRTLVFGLDAADWDIIEPLLERDRLPNLAKLIEKGTRGDLQSTRPAMTPQAWTSMASGVNPGKHGVFDFRNQNRDTYQVSPINTSEVNRTFLWDILNSRDINVGVVNFPLAHPPSENCEFFISGIPTPPNATVASPPELQDIIDDSNYRVHPRVEPDDGISEYYKDLVDLTNGQASVMKTLLKEHELELAIVVFMGIDWIQHYFWEDTLDGDRVVNLFYEHMDEILGDLMTAFGPNENTIVMSDHGATKLEGEIHLNSLLEEKGYLVRADRSQSMRERFTEILLKNAWNIGGKLPHNIKSRILDYTPESFLNDLQTAAEFGQSNLHNKIAWSETTAFSYGSMGRIFIHTKDNYPEGTVSESEYEDVRTELVSLLEDLQNPETSKQVVEDVCMGEKIYTGPESGEAPDIVFTTNDSKYMCYGDFGEEWIHEPRHRVADHTTTGILAMSGEPFSQGNTNAHIYDLAPTLLYLHGLPILDDMDGSVLEEAFIEEFREKNKITKTGNYDLSKHRSDTRQTSTDEVESRLEDLGYL